MSRLVPIALAAATVAAAVWFYPHDCDAVFAAHDPIWYACGAERAPLETINSHHPLFHLIVDLLVIPLRAAAVMNPGTIATRIVAGLGGAWLLFQIAALAGRRRVLVGAAFGLVVLTTRGFFFEVATGENVVPAAAAALWALTLAARPAPKLFATGAALTLALLLRQDNVLAVPGIAGALALGLPRGQRIRGVALVLVFAAAATVAGYLAVWWLSTGGSLPAIAWATELGSGGPWSGPGAFDPARFQVYFQSMAEAATGKLFPQDPGALIGPLYLAAMLVAGFLLRGSDSPARFAVAVVPTLVCRAFFHAWYEADNFEWLVLTFAFVAAFGARLASGAPVTPPVACVAGVAMLVALASWFAVAHGPASWILREKNLRACLDEATSVDRKKWRFIAIGARPRAGLHMLGVPQHFLPEQPLGASIAAIEAERARRKGPTTVIVDRFAHTGMPSHVARRLEPLGIDAWSDGPTRRLLRHRGLVYGIRMEDPPASRPSSR